MPPRRRYQENSRILRRYKPRRRAPARRSYVGRALGTVSRYARSAARSSFGKNMMSNLGYAAAAGLAPALAPAFSPAIGSLTRAAGRFPSAAYNFYKQVSGQGDYTVKRNTLMGTHDVDSLPTFRVSKSGVRIVHREYLGDVISSGTAGQFVIQKYPVQPGISFPWLAPIAAQFQQYKWNGVIFEYKTMSSDALNSTNTALGTCICASNYVVTSPDFNGPQQMYQSDFVSATKPSMSVLHPIECAPSQSKFLMLDVRTGPAASFSNDDLRLYDFANFYIASYGCQGENTKLGELWSTYDISLYKPLLGSSIDVGDHYQINSGQSVNSYWGNPIATPTTTSDLGSVLTNTGGGGMDGTITIPQTFNGNLLLLYTAAGGTAVNTQPPTVVTSSGINVLNLFFGNSMPYLFTQGATDPIFIMAAVYSVVGGGTIIFKAGTATFPSSPQGGDLFLVSWPSTLIN